MFILVGQAIAREGGEARLFDRRLIVVATNKKKTIKYEETKIIELVDEKDQYNHIGFDEQDAAGRAYIASKTRQNAALTRDSTANVKIDEKKIEKKKNIEIPETKPDDSYYELIKNKRELVTELANRRGYWRVFLDDHLPNPDIYNCTDADLEALASINSKFPATHHIKSEDFEKIVEIWESEIGQIYTSEKKRLGVCPPDLNRLDLDKGKTFVRESKELAQFCKNPSFNELIKEVHKVSFYFTKSTGMRRESKLIILS